MKKIINLEMPKFSEYGSFQLGSLSKVHFRFDLVNGKPKLMPDMFVEGDGFKECLEGTQMYKDVQEALDKEVSKDE